MSESIFQSPGLHTDTSNPRDAAFMAGNGFKWIVQQTQNGANAVKPWDLSAYRAAGFKVGVWGVHYEGGSIVQDCERLVYSASGAGLLVFNVEYVLSATQAKQIVDRLAVLNVPKALICLVGELVPMKETGAIKVFLDAGWQIIGETYTNDQANLTPAEAEWQAKNAGIPVDRFSHALGMYPSANGQISGAQYAALLQQAGSGRRFSAWMVEHGADSSYSELKSQALAPNPVVTPVPKPAPQPPVSSIVIPRAELEKDVVELEGSLAYKLGWGKVVRPTLRLRRRLMSL